MRRLAVVLAMAVLSLGVAATPAAGQSDPPLVVTPSTDLIDGQLVSLQQSVVVPNTIIPVGITVATCVDAWSGERPCNVSSESGPFVYARNDGRVARFVEVDGAMVDCAEVACSLVYTESACVNLGQPFGTCAFIESVSVEAPVSFRVGPGVGTVGSWADGEEIRVVATGLESGPPAAAFAAQCAFRSDGAFLCGGGTGALETQFDGEYDATLVLEEQFSSAGLTADCSVDICLVVVVVLGAGYQLVDAGSTYRVWDEVN